jgi:hypothetical protein
MVRTNHNSRCGPTQVSSSVCRAFPAGADLCGGQHRLQVSRTSYARSRCQMGFPVHRSSCFEMVLPLSPQDQCSSSDLVFPRLPPVWQPNQTGLECNRGKARQCIAPHFRQHYRGRKGRVLHLFGMQNRTKSLRNRHQARSSDSVRWMYSRVSGPVSSDSVDNWHKAYRRLCE